MAVTLRFPCSHKTSKSKKLFCPSLPLSKGTGDTQRDPLLRTVRGLNQRDAFGESDAPVRVGTCRQVDRFWAHTCPCIYVLSMYRAV